MLCDFTKKYLDAWKEGLRREPDRGGEEEEEGADKSSAGDLFVVGGGRKAIPLVVYSLSLTVIVGSRGILSPACLLCTLSLSLFGAE